MYFLSFEVHGYISAYYSQQQFHILFTTKKIKRTKSVAGQYELFD